MVEFKDLNALQDAFYKRTGIDLCGGEETAALFLSKPRVTYPDPWLVTVEINATRRTAAIRRHMGSLACPEKCLRAELDLSRRPPYLDLFGHMLIKAFPENREAVLINSHARPNDLGEVRSVLWTPDGAERHSLQPFAGNEQVMEIVRAPVPS